MDPRQFRKYILNELSFEDRKSLMLDEQQRSRTFYNWPHAGELNDTKMAKAGFYSLGQEHHDLITFQLLCVFRMSP